MKLSPISSSSCIILKYQELFKSQSKDGPDLVISECTLYAVTVDSYYVDNEGYLLDCHSRYLVDLKGKKISLEEKHIAMLKQQRIL